MLLKYKNINIHYSDSGKGTALVFLHGFLETSSIWNPFIETLSKKNRVVCIDLLGHGKTECLGYIHTMEDMADAVHAVLSHLKLRKYILAGHSMGGYVALAYAEHYPDNIKGLCLINSSARADSEERKANRDRAIKAVKQNHKAFISMSIANLFAPENRETFSKRIETLKQEALELPLQGIVAALEGMKIRPDREALLHFSPYKKLMILGEKDPVLNYEEIKEQLLDTEVKAVIFDSGHMSFIENESNFLLEIMHFIENM
ncbi:MAG TPA: alpha/beta hydrolase [Flavobacteriaceae bacterium]|nr:alpha/beta hydrolase [Flavobacteriaceae bacterium]